MNVIEVKNLRKIYSPRKRPTLALKGINFAVAKGEVFGILGVNGAGKSTTLNILIGLLEPTSGEVRILGKDFFQNTVELKGKMNIASAYADLATNLTVYQNLKVYALMYDVRNHRQKIEELMARFKIADLRNQMMGVLSAGERTRVNLCKSLVNEPQVLLLDEPTASLDPSIAAKTRKLLLDFCRQKDLTILLTSHNMREVEQMCDRVALLHQGQIYKVDTPASLQKFLHVPSMEEVFIKLAEEEDEP